MNISALLSPICGAKPFKMRMFFLCLNVSWCVPAGLAGRQNTCPLKAGRQEEAGEPRMAKMQNDEIQTSSFRVTTSRKYNSKSLLPGLAAGSNVGP